VSREPLAGQTTLTLEQPVTGWSAGDHLVIPDTRQLRADQRQRTPRETVEQARMHHICRKSWV